MSISALNWAFASPIKGAAKSVLLALANAANDDGVAWPSTAKLAVMAGVAKRHVVRVLVDLEAAGMVVANRRHGATSSYRLLIGNAPTGDIESPQGENVTGDTMSPTGDISASERAKTGDMVSKTGDMVSSKPLEPKKEREPPLTKRACARDGDPPGFAAFWAAYPRKVGRGQALRAYRAALKVADDATLLMAIVHYPFDRTRPQFIPHASTWLNGQRWLDQIQPPELDAHARLMAAVGLAPDGSDLQSKTIDVFAVDPHFGRLLQ